MQSVIANGCRKVYIDGRSGKQVIPKLWLQVYVRELQNIMVIPPEEIGLKEARYKENNIIIRTLRLSNIITPQLKKMSY